jgi:PKD repeat protein
VGPVGASPSVTDTCTGTPAVQFTASVTGSEPLSRAWSFGDGGTSSAPQPTHQYTQPGTFTVTLAVSNSAGKASGSTQVTVNRCANTTGGTGPVAPGTPTVGTVTGGTATPVAAIPNIGERRARLLTDSGRTTAADVAAMSVDEIAEVLKVSPELAEAIRLGAQEVSGKE